LVATRRIQELIDQLDSLLPPAPPKESA